MSDLRILGIDLSLNHTGVVELNESGEVTWFQAVVDVASAAGRAGSVLLPKFPKADRQQAELERLEWWDRYMGKLMAERRPHYVGIEDYARGSQSNSEYQIGELGGIARRWAWKAGAALRLHEPLTVKMFGAGTANATGYELAVAVKEQFPYTSFAEANPVAKSKSTLPEEDLAAAFVVARMVYVESCLRVGSMELKDLAPKQIQVFNRATKYLPTSLLGRDWLASPTAGAGLLP